MRITKAKLQKIILEELQLMQEENLPPEPWYETAEKQKTVPYGVSPFFHDRTQYKGHMKHWPKPDYRYHMIDVLQAGPTHPEWDSAYGAAQAHLGPIAPEMAGEKHNIQQLRDRLEYEDLQSKWLDIINQAGKEGIDTSTAIGWMNLDLAARQPKLHKR